MKYSRLASLVAGVLLAASCGGMNPPPSLSPVGAKYWRADLAQVAVIDIKNVAQGLNSVQRCDATGQNCAPLLSDKNTGYVMDAVEAAILTLRAAPDGWKAAVTVALQEIEQKVDAAALVRIRPYLEAARAVLAQIEGD